MSAFCDPASDEFPDQSDDDSSPITRAPDSDAVVKCNDKHRLTPSWCTGLYLAAAALQPMVPTGIRCHGE